MIYKWQRLHGNKTGGEAIAPNQLGLNSLELVEVQPVVGGRLFEFDHTNNKIKSHSALGTEVTATTNISAVTVRIKAMG